MELRLWRQDFENGEIQTELEFLVVFLNHLIYQYFRSLIKTDSEFTIISSNCIGGVIYSDLHRKFLSPTINLFFSAKDFLKFVFNNSTSSCFV